MMADSGMRINVRLDGETARDLRALERYLRNTPSGVVRLAIAELARKYGLSEETSNMVIELGEVYRNTRAGFEVRVVENRDDPARAGKPRYLVETRPAGASQWTPTSESDDNAFLACA